MHGADRPALIKCGIGEQAQALEGQAMREPIGPSPDGIQCQAPQLPAHRGVSFDGPPAGALLQRGGIEGFTGQADQRARRSDAGGPGRIGGSVSGVPRPS